MVTAARKKNLQTTIEIGKSIRAHYANVQVAKQEGKPVVWTFGLIPREVFHFMDVPIITLEHFAIMLSAKQVSGKNCEVAEERGFSRDLCAWQKAVIGCALNEERGPFAEQVFTAPDLIVASNYPCIAESRSSLYLIEHLGCPYIFIDTPVNTRGEDIPDHAIEYYTAQLQELISFLENYGYKPNWARLKQAVDLSRRLTLLWDEIDDFRRLIPTPFSASDGITCSYPLAQLPGTDTAIKLYEGLLSEVRERAEGKVGVLDEEKLRLLWLGLPPFYNLGAVTYPERYGAVVAKSETEYLLGGGVAGAAEMDAERPLESLARKAITGLANPTYANRINYAVKMVKELKIDGVIAANERGCRMSPAGLRLMKDAIYKETGVATTIFDLDAVDLREYDYAAVKERIDSFIETLLLTERRADDKH